MYTANWFRRIAGIGTALSVSTLALLSGCNHDDNDCNSCCDNGPGPVVRHHHEHASADNGRIEVAPAQATTYENERDADSGVNDLAYENDIYYRQHRNDTNFDRNVYFGDRAAYIRTHEGEPWYNDHRIELEASWGDRGRGDRDNRDNRNSAMERSNKERSPVNTSVEDRNTVRDSRVEQRNEQNGRENAKTQTRSETFAPATTNGTSSTKTETKSKDATPENGRNESKQDMKNGRDDKKSDAR